MKAKLLPLLAALLLAACSRPSGQAPAPADESHPLRGVITDVVAAESALMVKHEDIPGFMPAMTMLLKVDPATLTAVAKNQAITATIYRQGGEYWLRDVKPIAARK